MKGNRKYVSISNEQQYRFEVNMQQTVISATVKQLELVADLSLDKEAL